MRKKFNIAANVCAIVLMSLMAIGALVIIAGLSLAGTSTELTEEELAVIETTQSVSVALLLFCVGAIVVASITLAKGNKKKALGLKITMIVLMGIIAVLEFMGSSLFYGVLCLVPIGLEIASICTQNPEDEYSEASDEPSTEE